jgi:hypothetical protein
MMGYTKPTCVVYEDGDVIGKLLAFSSLLPLVYVVHAICHVHSRRYAAMLV